MADPPATRLLFSTTAYEPLAERVQKAGTFQPGRLERRTFPDGERYVRLASEVTARDVILLAGTVSDADTLETYDIASGLVENGARSLTLVIPYFGYSTMERASHPGEVITAKTRARLLSSIPVAPAGSRVLLLDLHSEGVAHYFEGNLRPTHVSGKPVILDALRKVGLDDAVLACTDAGRAKWVESLANDLQLTASFVFKRRLGDRLTEVSAVSAQVEGKHVIIYDDMIRTGSSLLAAARAYKDSGAREMSAITTHGVFPQDALARVADTGLFERIICTDSHPRALQAGHARLQVVSVAGLLASALSG